MTRPTDCGRGRGAHTLQGVPHAARVERRERRVRSARHFWPGAERSAANEGPRPRLLQVTMPKVSHFPCPPLLRPEVLFVCMHRSIDEVWERLRLYVNEHFVHHHQASSGEF